MISRLSCPDEALAIAKGFIGTSGVARIEVRPVVEIDLPAHENRS